MQGRLDALIQQLHAQKADALLLEAGNSLFLQKGGDSVPLVNARLSNEHVVALLKEAAPPDARPALQRREAVQFDYASPSGPVHVELANVDGQMYARVTPGARPRPAPHLAPPSNSLDDASAEVPFPPLMDGRPVIESWFDVFLSTEASDLHLTPGIPAMVRTVDGEMCELTEIPVVSPAELEQMLVQIMPLQNREEWTHMRDTDFAYDTAKGRLRVNVFCDLRGPCGTFRRIPGEIKSVADLELPDAVVDLCRLKKGLVLVTGPTGSGKSTTLAAMIDWINENRTDHIITIEDPIEFVHTPKKCLIHQRQVGVHTRSYSRALRAALREDPDIILVGELRDLESVALAIEVAETGHLVFATLHTATAATTVDRIVDQFAADKQEQVRQLLADSLRGVVAQTLCKRIDGGRVLALEILLVTTAVSNMIRERKTFQLGSVQQTSRAMGMRVLNDSLLELAKNNVIDAQEALDRSVDKPGLKRDLIAAHILVPSTGGT